ncbi:MAG: DUF1343 domain-containing protein [Crocinitomicaceae bacterium]
MKFLSVLYLSPFLLSCSSGQEHSVDPFTESNNLLDTSIVEASLYCNDQLLVGAARFEEYLEDLKGKKVAVVGNQSSLIGQTHLVDSLLSLEINVVKVFSPEHGFRGKADAGEKVTDDVDSKTGLPIISLYGKNKKPTAEQLKNVEVLVFDIQDVGARFYTYISTLHYIMEAAAEQEIEVIVLDRPNPNGHYVDGPLLEEGYASFVGMHQVPVVHGMTVGEYARMINEEGWLSDGRKAELKVVPCKGWDHTLFYELPVSPSPNLPNMKAVYWYPSLCFFEGTIVSIGRGTDIPFQCVGHPGFEVEVLEDLYSFVPAPTEGAKQPKLEGQYCYGYNLSLLEIEEIRDQKKLNLFYLIEFYQQLKDKHEFFLTNNFFHLLSGSETLKEQIIAGKSEEEIRKSWQTDLEEFKKKRKQYLLYKDFE